MRNARKRVMGATIAGVMLAGLTMGCAAKPHPETLAAAQRAESAALKAETAARDAAQAAGRVEDAARRAEAAAQKAEAIFMKHMRK